MSNTEEDALAAAKKSLVRIQDFDTTALPRLSDLGTSFSFEPAVLPANRIISLYKKLTVTALDDFPPNLLDLVQKQADSDFQLFKEVLEFKSEQGAEIRSNIIGRIDRRYNELFAAIYPLISYSMHKAVDFADLDARARAKLQEIDDRVESEEETIQELREEAQQLMTSVKEAAAEQGVTQQAIYFKDEAEAQKANAKKWYKYSIWVACILLAYSLFIFLSWVFGWLPKATTMVEVVQSTVSKVLIFAVLFLALYFVVKNYMSCKHNEVLNRHRQNALLTYRAIVGAASVPTNTDIILNQASSCIFTPQSTGFIGQKNSSLPANSSPISYLINKATGDQGE